MKRVVLVAWVFSMLTVKTFAQRTCATDELLQQALRNDTSLQRRMNVEEAAIKLYTGQHTSNKTNKTNSGSINIPVVVHIIHHGEPVGTGGNISADQVYEQIGALNLDYRLLNSDSLIPSSPFWENSTDTYINFCLAT